MGKALIIGAGGVGRVVAHKCAQNHEVFEEILIASRTKSKCDQLKKNWTVAEPGYILPGSMLTAQKKLSV